jgi:hypothetical protein
MAIGDHTHAPRPYPRAGRYPGRRGRRREVYPIGKFVAVYLAAVVLSFAAKAWVICNAIEPVWFNVIAIHLCAGIALTRYILSRVAWNPNFSNLSVVARAKVLAVLFWPLTYLVFIVQLLIARYL